MRLQRSKQTTPFEERLAQMAQECRKKAKTLPPGLKREEMIRKARQAETAAQLNQVFGRDRLRDEQEQILVLQTRAGAPKKKPLAPSRRVRADCQRCGLLIGRNFAGREEIVEALAELSPAAEIAVGDLDQNLLVRVSANEHRHIKVRAAESGRTINDLVRDALRLAALI